MSLRIFRAINTFLPVNASQRWFLFLLFIYLRFAEAASFDKKSYAGAIHSPVEGGWISNSRPLLVLLSHVHVHCGGAVPDVRLAPDDGGGVDPVIVPPS